MKICEIKKTLEYKNYLKGMNLLIIFYIGFLLFTLVPLICSVEIRETGKIGQVILTFVLVYSVMFLPFIIAYAIILRNIVTIGKKMIVIETELTEPTSGYHGMMRFQIEVKNHEGEITKKTSKAGIRGELFNRYLNKKVKIGYLDDYDYFYIIENERRDYYEI